MEDSAPELGDRRTSTAELVSESFRKEHRPEEARTLVLWRLALRVWHDSEDGTQEVEDDESLLLPDNEALCRERSGDRVKEELLLFTAAWLALGRACAEAAPFDSGVGAERERPSMAATEEERLAASEFERRTSSSERKP